jgi:hypothetical protein
MTRRFVRVAVLAALVAIPPFFVSISGRPFIEQCAGYVHSL